MKKGKASSCETPKVSCSSCLPLILTVTCSDIRNSRRRGSQSVPNMHDSAHNRTASSISECTTNHNFLNWILIRNELQKIDWNMVNFSSAFPSFTTSTFPLRLELVASWRSVLRQCGSGKLSSLYIMYADNELNTIFFQFFTQGPDAAHLDDECSKRLLLLSL